MYLILLILIPAILLWSVLGLLAFFRWDLEGANPTKWRKIGSNTVAGPLWWVILGVGRLYDDLHKEEDGE